MQLPLFVGQDVISALGISRRFEDLQIASALSGRAPAVMLDLEEALDVVALFPQMCRQGMSAYST